MRSSISVVAILAGAASVLAQGLPVVNTPTSLIVCQPASITFSAGTAPYIISVLPGGQISAAALETFPTQTAAGSYTWTVDIPAGTSVTLAIRDATGMLNYSQAVTIQAGTSTSCIGAAAASGTTSKAAVTTTAASSAAASSPATSAAPATTTAAASSVSKPASSAPASSAPATSAPATSAPASSPATATASAPAASTSAAKSGAGSLKAYGANVLALVGAAVVAIAA